MLLGEISTVEEHMAIVSKEVVPSEDDLYRYLNFNKIEEFKDESRVIPLEKMPKIEEILGIPAGMK